MNYSQQAELEFQKALKLNRRLAEARQSLGFALIQMGRNREALENFREVSALYPNRAEGHYGQGLALAALGGHENAVAEFTLAEKLMEASAPALDRAEIILQKGISLESLGRSNEALYCFQRASSVAPSYNRPLHRLGVALARAGRTEEAENTLVRALALDPGYLPAIKDLETLRSMLSLVIQKNDSHNGRKPEEHPRRKTR